EYLSANSLIGAWIGNLTNGKKAVLLWTWENGRIFQTLSLFMLGMLAGRKGLFIPNDENRKFWLRTFMFSAIAFVPLFIVKNKLGGWIDSEAIRRPLVTAETSWSNMAFMLVLVSGFTLLFQNTKLQNTLQIFSPIGRMSLSNYIIQSVVGSFIYYGFGLGLYQYTGSTYSLLIGLVLAVLQGYFSAWWMKRHKHGPLEGIWHKGTWIGVEKKSKKPVAQMQQI
ncbi:MAG: DUF418 domain-containing protein, partial [Bacteroidales bacterium]|nr:DUF418 domain-containing protein [Bacteroidales bacterium]